MQDDSPLARGRSAQLPLLPVPRRHRRPRPLEIVGDISRATVIAASGNRFFDVDLSGIESRGIALIANEFTKLNQWRKFDQTGQEENEPYYVFGTAGLNLDKGIARTYGKTGDLAFGYQGGTGAWRKMAPPGDTTPDHKVREFQKAWARAHPNIAKFWGVALRQAMNAIESKTTSASPPPAL